MLLSGMVRMDMTRRLNAHIVLSLVLCSPPWLAGERSRMFGRGWPNLKPVTTNFWPSKPGSKRQLEISSSSKPSWCPPERSSRPLLKDDSRPKHKQLLFSRTGPS